jgi:hypothetical protein
VTYWEISTRNMLKSTYFSIEIERHCQEMPKFPGLDKFLDLDWNFWVPDMSRQNWKSSIEISQLLRWTFWQCQDRDSPLRPCGDKSRHQAFQVLEIGIGWSPLVAGLIWSALCGQSQDDLKNRSLGTIQIIRVNFLDSFRLPPPPCVNLCHFSTPPLINTC